jgi:sugar phosphate isomerase/epimerase
MNLAISNIAWTAENDKVVYDMMKKQNYSGLEIAPTRIFPNNPYDNLKEAKIWLIGLERQYGFVIPSLQSIWYGRQEKLFGTDDERNILVDYTKKAVDFAVAIGCKNLVFGCPRNRTVTNNDNMEIGIKFFTEIGNYALEKGTVIGMEANPPIYNTNYINDTSSAIELIKEVDSDGFKLNLDIGTMIQNEEPIDVLVGYVRMINHVHISEPNLKPIEKRKIHKELKELLTAENYNGFISIEMGKTDDLHIIENTLDYVKEIFG